MQTKNGGSNYYETLNISENAPQEVVRAAFKALAQKFHPDKSAGSPEAERLMKAINEAYHTLGDVKRREQYDERLARSRQNYRNTQSPSQPPNPPPPSPPPSQTSSHAEEDDQFTAIKPKKSNFDTSFWLSCIVSFAIYRLFGLIGGISCFAIYYILQDKIGKLQAGVIGLISGILIATGAGLLITKNSNPPPTQSTAQDYVPLSPTKPLENITPSIQNPAENRKQQEDAHFAEINRQNPDFEKIINSKGFSDWFYKGSAEEVNERKRIYQSGTAQEVNLMLSTYKKYEIKLKKEQEIINSLASVKYRLAYSPYPISFESQKILDQITDEVLLTYPILRRADGQRLLDAVIAERNRLINQGISPAQAVNDAAQAVMRPSR